LNLLVFFIPPIAGAIIGYSTNVLAVRMLFRPLEEIRIFGIRLPFTPGILPKQRYKLAESVGGMVERELITPEILRERLFRDDVRENIKQMLSHFTEKILEKSPGELFDGQEKLLSSKIYDAADKLYPTLTQAIMSFLNRDDIRKELESKGRIILRNIFLKFSSFQRFFLSAGQYDLTLEEKMPEIINDLAANAGSLLSDNKVKMALLTAITSSFEKVLGAQSSDIKMLININEADKKALDDFLFQKLMSAADGQIENILSSINIKSLVSQRIDSLDMVRVERIVLDVMSDQFKWVEIFGGILGFLIGLFQAGFTYFLR
jgi:uncharacterized membrane protein YheB (UPF0754 family)